MIVVPGNHYGHPNMARVRVKGDCDAEGTFTAGSSTAPGTTSPEDTFPASTNGITEYVSHVFGGQLKGHLFACLFKVGLVELNTEAKKVDQDGDFPCLDVTVGPGGALYGANL